MPNKVVGDLIDQVQAKKEDNKRKILAAQGGTSSAASSPGAATPSRVPIGWREHPRRIKEEEEDRCGRITRNIMPGRNQSRQLPIISVIRMDNDRLGQRHPPPPPPPPPSTRLPSHQPVASAPHKASWYFSSTEDTTLQYTLVTQPNYDPPPAGQQPPKSSLPNGVGSTQSSFTFQTQLYHPLLPSSRLTGVHDGEAEAISVSHKSTSDAQHLNCSAFPASARTDRLGEGVPSARHLGRDEDKMFTEPVMISAPTTQIRHPNCKLRFRPKWSEDQMLNTHPIWLGRRF
ncbi:unnamed protein product [Zymoseptoria tritici ST99CH_1A5]|uniref:Uncharacterized protein n=1 Tax=Zymoseptoria tritici ST99CH_1A5 TaxID=1276529 RepID=A0A1Y6M131_ZYMTR|nr:unnamed protein product [Zymoseptoria tritici ST99CH_1A5]